MPESPSGADSPLFEAKQYDKQSVFSPNSLLQEARRQKDLTERDVPDVCVLDPDGDIVDHLIETDQAEKDSSWPGYHTDLYRFVIDGEEIGIIGRAVGASFAVLVAEQLFAAGCRFLVSITSSGQIVSKGEPPYFVLIERALRDEGTSLHYNPPGRYAKLAPDLQSQIETAVDGLSQPVHVGKSWTTDAPFRETQTAIDRARSENILAVEMEAAALYSFAQYRDRSVVCFAHVTNEMGSGDGDFEKGESNGSVVALEIIERAVEGWKSNQDT